MTMVGTPFYVAPEVVMGDHYSSSADVFSCGLTILTFAIKGGNEAQPISQEVLHEEQASEDDASCVNRYHCNSVGRFARRTGLVFRGQEQQCRENWCRHKQEQ